MYITNHRRSSHGITIPAREDAMSSKVLDLPLHLALSLPPLDRLSLVLQVLPTGEAYLPLELVLLVEVRTQPGC